MKIYGKPEKTYACAVCSRKLLLSETKFKILSIMYRPKHDQIHAFEQYKCPYDENLLTIIFHTMDGSLKGAA